MASFEDLAFDWSTLCQECPECWTASVFLFWTIFPFAVCSMLPLPTFKNGPFCASNFETFSSKSRYFDAQKRDPSLQLLHKGKCKRMCQMYAPVCGSNEKTYTNICYLDVDMKSDKSIFYKYNGVCMTQSDIKPKNGNMKIFDFSYYDPDYDNRFDSRKKRKLCALS